MTEFKKEDFDKIVNAIEKAITTAFDEKMKALNKIHREIRKGKASHSHSYMNTHGHICPCCGEWIHCERGEG